MKRPLILIAAVAALLAPLCARADGPGGIAGYVLDKHTQKPIPGVAVVIVRYTKRLDERSNLLTDRHGFFTHLTLAPGRYLVTASVEGRSASCIVDDVYGDVVRHVKILVGANGEPVVCVGPGVNRNVIDPDQPASVYRV